MKLPPWLPRARTHTHIHTYRLPSFQHNNSTASLIQHPHTFQIMHEVPGLRRPRNHFQSSNHSFAASSAPPPKGLATTQHTNDHRADHFVSFHPLSRSRSLSPSLISFSYPFEEGMVDGFVFASVVSRFSFLKIRARGIGVRCSLPREGARARTHTRRGFLASSPLFAAPLKSFVLFG